MLVPIQPPQFEADLDLRYATADNLARRVLYRQPLALIHADAVAPLSRALALAGALGLRLRVFDAYRPTEVQWALWEALPDPEYIADPRQGSNHSRGVAIDLTLDDADGTPLDMGTAFDDMTVQSHHGRLDIPVAAQRNRALLLGLMMAAGWSHYASEWWHFQLPDAGRYPLLADGVGGPKISAV